MKSIIHLTTSHRPTDTRILKRECVALSENRDYRVRLFNAFGMNDRFRDVDIVGFDRRRGRFGRYTISIFKAIFSVLREKPDLVHLHDPELFFSVIFFKMRGIKVVVDIHEKFADKFTLRSWMPNILSPLFVRLFNLILQYVDRNADAIVVAAPFLLADFGYCRRISVRNLPDLQYIGEVENTGPREENLIIYTGGLSEHRGIEPVIRALSGTSENWKLVIYGKRSPVVVEKLGELLNDSRIDYRGLAPFEEVVQAMQTASVGVVCNEKGLGYENALPNKIFEYMAAGVAIVCTDFPEWKKLVEENQAGLTCNPHDAASVKNAIFSFLGSPAKISDAGKCGRRLVETEYSWASEKLRLFEIYREIL